VAGHYAKFMAAATAISINTFFEPFIPTAELWGILAHLYKFIDILKKDGI
jgi:hypothetical protein